MSEGRDAPRHLGRVNWSGFSSEVPGSWSKVKLIGPQGAQIPESGLISTIPLPGNKERLSPEVWHVPHPQGIGTAWKLSPVQEPPLRQPGKSLSRHNRKQAQDLRQADATSLRSQGTNQVTGLSMLVSHFLMRQTRHDPCFLHWAVRKRGLKYSKCPTDDGDTVNSWVLLIPIHSCYRIVRKQSLIRHSFLSCHRSFSFSGKQWREKWVRIMRRAMGEKELRHPSEMLKGWKDQNGRMWLWKQTFSARYFTSSNPGLPSRRFEVNIA